MKGGGEACQLIRFHLVESRFSTHFESKEEGRNPEINTIKNDEIELS